MTEASATEQDLQVWDAGMDYRHLLDSHPDPMVVLDAEGRFLWGNRSVDSMLADGEPDAGDPHLSQLGIDPQEFSGLARRARERGVVTYELEVAGPTPRHLAVRLVYLPLLLPDESAYLWVAHDVTARVHLEQERQQLVHMIVHDLRVPLGNILNSLDLVLTAWRERDVTLPAEQVLEIGLRSAHRMDQLISDILDSARLQAKERGLAVAPIDVEALLREAVEALSASAKRREQIMTVEVQQELPLLNGDPDLLRRVLTNLIGNAVKYTQDQGRIDIRVEADADVLTFTVSDNGRGIAPDDQEHIFELFFRGGPREQRGAGIGLAFCKLAVEAHGGRIWFESVEGSGSAFSFTIPRVLPKRATCRSRDGQ